MIFKQNNSKVKIRVFCFLSIIFFSGLVAVFVIMARQPFIAYLSPKKSNPITKNYIANVLKKLSIQERRDLEALFRRLFLGQGFAYTLFDVRALAYTAYFKRDPVGNILCGRIGQPVGAWWRTWEKYKSHFPMERFALITREDHIHNTVNIYLVNKKLLIELLHAAQPDAKWVLNSGKSLQELAKIFDEFSIEELPNRTEILGVLLGYGENNSNLFYRREIIEKVFIPNSLTFGNAVITGDLIRLTKKLELLNNTLQSMRTYVRITPPEFLHPVGFLVDNETNETKQVIHKFSKSRDKICRGYAQDNFLQVTLERLTASDS